MLCIWLTLHKLDDQHRKSHSTSHINPARWPCLHEEPETTCSICFKPRSHLAKYFFRLFTIDINSAIANNLKPI